MDHHHQFFVAACSEDICLCSSRPTRPGKVLDTAHAFNQEGCTCDKKTIKILFHPNTLIEVSFSVLLWVVPFQTNDGTLCPIISFHLLFFCWRAQSISLSSRRARRAESSRLQLQKEQNKSRLCILPEIYCRSGTFATCGR